MLVGALAAAVLWMHVLAGSSSRHGVVLPDGGTGHGAQVTLPEGHGVVATAASAVGPDGVLPTDADQHGDQHGSAGPMCLMVLVALVTLAARGALRRRTAEHPTTGTPPRLAEPGMLLAGRPPDLHTLGISRT